VKIPPSVFVFAALVVAVGGTACRWEAWDYRDPAGASVFHYRSLLLPWQDAPAPPAGVAASTVTVQRWSYFGLNRFDFTGSPDAAAALTGTSTRNR
jgi:hypothetical protein